MLNFRAAQALGLGKGSTATHIKVRALLVLAAVIGRDSVLLGRTAAVHICTHNKGGLCAACAFLLCPLGHAPACAVALAYATSPCSADVLLHLTPAPLPS